MDIWVPWTDLAPQTAIYSARVEAMRYELTDPDEGYGVFMARRWRTGADFVVVEQDVVPGLWDVAALSACPEPLCFYGYQGQERTCLVFGCVKFSAGFIASYPSLWIRYAAAKHSPEGHPDHDFSAARCRRWMMLPEWVEHATNAQPHLHGRVRHLARMAGNR